MKKIVLIEDDADSFQIGPVQPEKEGFPVWSGLVTGKVAEV